MRYSATSYTRSGVADWLAQRVSAYVLAAYFVVIVGYLLCNPDLEYVQWKDFMSCSAMQIFSLLALLALAAHAWVGLWTVFTDYVTERQMGAKATFIRIFLQAGMAICIFVYVVWGIQILWGN
jgi:succinate dehydrogenase / fumarate reductase membrane anchor subunit